MSRGSVWTRHPQACLLLCAWLATQGVSTPGPSPASTPATGYTPTPPGVSQTPQVASGTEHTSRDFYQYRVCSAAVTGELFRFNLDQTCPDTKGKPHHEGILLVYKKNIVPHMFKVRRYRKTATSVTVYRGFTESAITNKFDMPRSVPLYEINHMDSTYQCFSGMKVMVNGVENTFTDRDSVNKTVFLQPVEGLTDNIQRYFSQPVIYSEPGWFPGIYRVRTTVNCEIVDMTARSTEPYNYFVTALGDTVEVSPFCHNDSSCSTTPKTSNELTVRVVANHTVVNYADRGTRPTPRDRIFVDSGTYTVSWVAQDKATAVCQLARWKTFLHSIRTTHESSYHFVANEITATFTAPLTEVDNFSNTYSCLTSDINSTLEAAIEKLNTTHLPEGPVQYFHTEGGLFLVWQPMNHKNLSYAEQEVYFEAGNLSHTARTTAASPTSRSRQRRNAANPIVPGVQDFTSTAQLQFAYDRLRDSINHVLEELSRAWCREQVRDNLMWYELSKINPTSVMTAIYGRPVSARFVGDAISVTECIVVDQTSVSIHKSLHDRSSGLCYSRPQVTFKFLNSSTLFTGQLGTRGEIILSENHVEACRETCEHYFITSNETLVYKDYLYVGTINTTDITTLNTFLALNLTFIENIDFKAIELYGSAEKRLASNAFDLETMFREYNYYTQRLTSLRNDFDSSLDLNRDRFVRDMSDLVADLGGIGKTVVNVASTVVTFFGSIVTGFINFIKNPFGGVLIIVILVGIILIIFMLNRRTNAMAQAPVKMIYPEIEHHAPQGGTALDQAEIKKILLGMHYLQQAEREKEAERKRSAPSLWSRASNGIRQQFMDYHNGIRQRLRNYHEGIRQRIHGYKAVPPQEIELENSDTEA
ncbi:envelope glycoprotein B [Colobine gammaherpesvirus 1]|uniref:Envelope glycoprotein B n=1 Tax=Colobine gammaherpesvirus 1 TaxID=2597325 RepID=A0A5B8G790_9GAMA|nr:envelope glycoprotein B [Colobine gammaherpesvirus 1]QDQ69215.1 envelope glycoprotein B [Colobine gammaherpesvirus 1]